MRTEFADRDVVFFLQVFRDPELAIAAVERVRQHYPGSRLVIVSDGDPVFPGDVFQERFGAEYHLDESLYGLDHGGRMVHRMLEHYMRSPAQYLLRMDTDARIDRRFRYLPAGGGVYGTLSRRNGAPQGGCILVSHAAASRMWNSRIFLSPKLLDHRSSWGRFSSPENLARNERLQRVSYDKVLFWGISELGIPVAPFPEIFSVWKSNPQHAPALANVGRSYAIVHPDKSMGEKRAGSS